MRTSRTLFLIYVSAFLAVNALFIALFALPNLAPARQALTDRFDLGSQEALLVVGWILSAVISGFILLRLATALYRPFHRMAHFISKNQHTIALQLEDTFKEERVIKRFMDSQDMRVIDAESQMEEMENQTARKLEQLNASIEDAKEAEERMADMIEAQRKLRLDNEILKAAKEASEYALDFERRSKVGAEVERRTEEIYLQMERAITNAAMRSLWQPSRLYELKIQTRIIEKTAERIQKYWKEISMGQLQEDLGEIRNQSQKQLNLIEALSHLEPPSVNGNRGEEPVQNVELLEEAPQQDEEENKPAASLPAHEHAKTDGKERREKAKSRPKPRKPPEPASSDSHSSTNSDTRPNDDLFDHLKDLLADISPKKEHVKIRLEVGPEIETPDDRDALNELLSVLIGLAARRVDHGRVTLKAEEKRDRINFLIYVDGTPNPDFKLDLDHAHRLLGDSEGSINAEQGRGHLLVLRYEHPTNVPARSGS